MEWHPEAGNDRDLLRGVDGTSTGAKVTNMQTVSYVDDDVLQRARRLAIRRGCDFLCGKPGSHPDSPNYSGKQRDDEREPVAGT